ncbi:MAG TPA: Crp/Fnr family transcriptional regulator [Armatimonadota bacterium]
MVHLFEDLGSFQLRNLESQGRRRQHSAGDTVIYRGDTGDAVYFLLDGCMKVHCSGPDQEEVVLDLLEAGSFFGEMAALESLPRTADVTALTVSEVFILESKPFLALVDSEPGVRRRLLQTQALRLRRLSRRLNSVATQDVGTRVAALLVEMADDQHQTAGAQWRVRFGATQSDLAAMVGATRESVNKILAALRREGIIASEPGAFLIPNPGALRERAAAE